MPCIQTTTNITINQDQESLLKEKLGKAISIIPGKSEQWLMLTFTQNCTMFFRGEQKSPMAFIEVKIFGKADQSAYNQLTGEICSIYQEVLNISPDHIYIKYEECSQWGWNGSNF